MGKYNFTGFPEEIDRVDAKAKVTGNAKYAAEYDIPGLTYGVMVGSTITKGTIAAMDTKAAERAPGVITVMTHLNLPELASYKLTEASKKAPETKKGYKVFQDNVIRYNGQPIAIVVADTMERAVYAASLVKAQYNRDDHHTDLSEEIKTGIPLEGKEYAEYVRGEKDVWKNAPVKIEAEYYTPLEVHHPMEMHAITVVWEGEDKITVYDKTQAIKNTQQDIAKLFGIPVDNVRVLSKYIGGAFGSAFISWPHTEAALIVSKKTGKPIKVSLNREQMFTAVGYRPEAYQKIGMGADATGKLLGITHEAKANTATFNEFTEGIVNISKTLYNTPNVNTRYNVYPLNLSRPTYMRGPGETTGTFALESAMDELAFKLNIDPIQFRLQNYTENDPEHNRPHSSKFLKECYQLGSDKIGWKNRRLQPRMLREGDWLAGYGMGTGVFIAWRGGSKVGAKFSADGRLTLQSAVTDMGPGTATAMTKLASDVFGLSPDKIKFELGDSKYPPGIFQGGSGTTSTLGTTVNNACITIKKKLAELVKDNSVFHTEIIHRVELTDIVFSNDFMSLKTDPSKKISYADVMKNAGLKQIEIVEESKGYGDNKYTTYSYSVHFVKVLVHEATGVVKVDKVVTAIDAGKIVSSKTAESQIIGGVVGGIGMALMEEGVIDHRYGRWVNNNFADYHVPVHTDVPNIDVLFVNKPDPVLNPMGSKGMGEIAMIGFPPAVANAVFNATGKRIRELPITPDKLI